MMQNAYGDQCLGRTQCYDWFKRFKNVGIQLMTTHVQDVRRHRQTMLM